MSRFERRLGSGGSSPRAGVATCKFRPKKKVTARNLTGFINVNQTRRNLQNQKLSRTGMNSQTNNIIQEVTSDNNEKDMLIQEVETVSFNDKNTELNKKILRNEQLKYQIKNTRNSVMKQLLIHELRLNTLDLNVDCLNDLKCESVLNEQKENEVNTRLEQMSENTDFAYEKVNEHILELEELRKNDEEYKNNTNIEINGVKSDIENFSNILNENNEKIDNLENRINKVNEKIQQVNDKFSEMENFRNELETVKIFMRELSPEIVKLSEIFAENIRKNNDNFDNIEDKDNLEKIDMSEVTTSIDKINGLYI